ncbi:MAG: asparagine synthase-related protein [Myxococcota bacterium]|nr:asparagine synthase-related protein [Myxococcota bacterium]
MSYSHPADVVYRPKMGFALPMARWWLCGFANVLRALMRDSPAAALGLIQLAPVLCDLEAQVAGGDRPRDTALARAVSPGRAQEEPYAGCGAPRSRGERRLISAKTP